MGEPTLTDDIVLTDEYGKRTRFRGTRLASESTDTQTGEKPQWAEVEVWRTDGGAYVIQRSTYYRIRHLSENCRRLGDNLLPRPATEADTYPCPTCNPLNQRGRWGVEPRSAVDVARTPAELIQKFAQSDGSYSGLARQVLADISEQDCAVADLWMEEVVP